MKLTRMQKNTKANARISVEDYAANEDNLLWSADNDNETFRKEKLRKRYKHHLQGEESKDVIGSPLLDGMRSLEIDRRKIRRVRVVTKSDIRKANAAFRVKHPKGFDAPKRHKAYSLAPIDHIPAVEAEVEVREPRRIVIRQEPLGYIARKVQEVLNCDDHTARQIQGCVFRYHSPDIKNDSKTALRLMFRDAAKQAFIKINKR